MAYHAVYRPAKSGDGHKVFSNDAGAIFLADWSGFHPGQTDDGPLLVEPNTTVTICTHNDKLTAIVPVKCTRDGNVEAKVWTTFATFLELRKALPLQAKLSDSLALLVKEMAVL